VLKVLWLSFKLHCDLVPLLVLNIYREEATEYIEIGSLNGLFVLGRTMGFIGK